MVVLAQVIVTEFFQIGSRQIIRSIPKNVIKVGSG